MSEKKDNQLSEKEFDLLKMTNNTVRLGFVCAIGVGIIALCSKIKINMNVTSAGGDLYRGEKNDEVIMKERKRIVNNLREKSYSDEQISELLSLSLEDLKNILE